jgi:hypothetical protein
MISEVTDGFLGIFSSVRIVFPFVTIDYVYTMELPTASEVLKEEEEEKKREVRELRASRPRVEYTPVDLERLREMSVFLAQNRKKLWECVIPKDFFNSFNGLFYDALMRVLDDCNARDPDHEYRVVSLWTSPLKDGMLRIKLM